MLVEVERFIQWVRRRNLAARTWRDYQYDLKQFVALVGDVPPAQVTLRTIDAFIQQQAAHGWKAATINRRLAAIAGLFTFLSDEDATLINPVLPHRHWLREPRRLPRPVPPEVLEKFFAVITDPRDRAMFVLMVRCGLRIAEAAALRLTDLYLHEACPRLVARGKGNKERAVYLAPQAERVLRAWLAVRPAIACEFVFLSYQGRGLSTTAIHYRLMDYRAAAGVRLTAHQLRHTFANDLVSVDVPVTTIQKLLGHAWLETTQTYITANDHQVQADLTTAAQKLEGWQ